MDSSTSRTIAVERSSVSSDPEPQPVSQGIEDPDQQTLLAEIESAVPLSVTPAERVEALRRWARGRAVPVA